MAHTVAILSLLICILPLPIIQGLSIGINYGRMASNLPPPQEVARFLSDHTLIDRVKLYDADPAVLSAFAGTGIAISVTIPNSHIPELASLPIAQRWVRSVLQPHIPATNITRVLVGNEVLSTGNRTLIATLVSAMQNLHTALVGAALHARIKVTTSHSLGMLAGSTPPSAGRFRAGYDEAVLRPLLSFLRATGGPFMVNAYPYFGFSDPSTLDYALFRANAGVADEGTGMVYGNMFDAQLDAVHSAMKSLGFGDVDVAVAETGWPSRGDTWQTAADTESARDYNNHLMLHCNSGVGTPLMPNRTIEAFIFSLFDEDRKPGPESERSFGLFHHDLTPVYDIGVMRSTTSSPPGTAGESAVLGQAQAPMVAVGESSRYWCVPKPHADNQALQANIDFVCGQGVDCRPIQQGGPCFFPDTVVAHAAYAMNAYYQLYGRNPYDCEFGQTGLVSTTDPSYGGCKYNS